MCVYRLKKISVDGFDFKNKKEIKMPRFFVEMSLKVGELVTLPDEVVRHIQVLRQREGDVLTLFNGQRSDEVEGEYQAQLISLEKRRATALVTEFVATKRESPLVLSLAQSLSSGDKMEFTIQKAVELGVTVIQPLVTQRCVLKVSADKEAKKLARWRDIVMSACEQSGRNVIPELRNIMTLNDFLSGLPQPSPENLRLLLSPTGAQGLRAIAGQPKNIWLMAGPEGGLTPQEESLILGSGWQALQLGARILRTETAALAAVSALQAKFGDFD
jgi:16S rRNA (uracil1498-N3)-methyltransferase